MNTDDIEEKTTLDCESQDPNNRLDDKVSVRQNLEDVLPADIKENDEIIQTSKESETSTCNIEKEKQLPVIKSHQSKRNNWSLTRSVFKFYYDLNEAEFEEKMSKYFTYDLNNDYFRQSKEISIPLMCRRDRIANEIMTSEQSYNHYIKILVNVWRNPLLAAAKDGAISVSESSINKIFGVIKGIEGISDLLLERFQEKLSNWSIEQTIGDIFIKYGDLLKAYSDYSKDRYTSKKCLDECMTRSSFQAFMDLCKRQPLNNNRFLSDYLIMPIQRVPRYELLLLDLLRNTPEGHPDIEYLKESISKIKLIAGQIDKSVEEFKLFEQIMQVQKKLSGSISLLQPGRRLIKEGILIKTCRKAAKSRMFWLFNDLLIYAIPTLGIYTLRAQIPMYTVELEDIPDDEEKGKKFAFIIRNKVKSFEVSASSKIEKYDWLVALNTYASESFKCRVSIVRNEDDLIGAQAPVWVPDSFSNYCELCSCEFNIIIRRHHCRNCGKIVCATCSSRRVPIPHLNKGNSRVCDVCYESIEMNKKAKDKSEFKKDSKSESTSIIKECELMDNEEEKCDIQPENQKSSQNQLN